MPINFPESRKEVIDRIKTDVISQLQNKSNPFLLNSFLQALMVGCGGRVFEVYIQMTQLLLEMFPDTATGTFLARWGSYIGVFLNASTIAQGNVVATGILGSIIPINSTAQTANGLTYTIQQTVTIQVNTTDIDSLTFSSGTVTAVTDGEHDYATGMQVTIAGADQADYNGTFVIFVTGINSFTYEIIGSPVPTATGTITAAATMAVLPITSDGFGADQNLGSGATLSLTTPLAGVDSTLFVQFGEIAGGTDVESQSDFRSRIITKYQNPNTPFNEANIIDVAREVNGVTRVFVETPDTTTGNKPVSSLTQVGGVARATFATAHELISGMVISISGAIQVDYNVNDAVILVDSPTSFYFLIQNNPTSPATGTIVSHFAAVQPGQVKVLFTRDNDETIIPSASEVDAVYNKLLTIKPAHTSAKDLIVVAPIAVPLFFTFSSITPDTPTMRSAVNANLEEFFRESTVVGQTLLAKAYNAAIYTTVDPESGEVLQDFILASPSGDISIDSGELPTFDGSNL